MKNKTTAGLLAICLGGVGIHHFYLGNLLKGVIFLALACTVVGAVVTVCLSLIKGLSLLAMNQKAFDVQYNQQLLEYRKA